MKREKKGILISMAVISVIIAFAIIASTPGYLGTILEGSWVIVLGPLALIWTFWFVWYRLQYRKAKDWEGTVTDKRIEEHDDQRKDEEGNRYTEHHTFYTVYFTDTKGKAHKLVREDSSSWYDYLAVGERVRYHGKYTNYYEKYDKSRMDFIPCAGCGSWQDARADYCADCGARLFKAAQQTAPEMGAARQRMRASRFCEDCGTELKMGAKFCSNCGKAVEG